MIEGLIAILVLSFLTLIFGIVYSRILVIITQAIAVAIIVFLLIRVRVKISKAEKEKLRAKIDELEGKIESLGKKGS